MTARRKHHQGQLGKAFGCVIALLTIVLLSWNLAGGNPSALYLHPLHQPNTLAPASDSLEVDPDPRATVLAQHLRQHLTGLQTVRHSRPASPSLLPSSAKPCPSLRPVAQVKCRSASVRWPRTPRQIKGTVLQQAQHGISAVGDSHLTTARTFLFSARIVTCCALTTPNAELVLVRRQTDELDRTHLRFSPTVSGRTRLAG